MSEQQTVEELERQAEKAQAAAARARKEADAARARKLQERDERLERFDRAFVEATSERARLHAEQTRRAETRLRKALLDTEFGKAYVEVRRLQRHVYEVGVETVNRRAGLGLDPGTSPPTLPDPWLLARMEMILEDEAARLAEEDLEKVRQEREAAAEAEPS